jgi:hypothetical protein
MTTELELKAQDYGINEVQEKELVSNLPQILLERDVLTPQYDEVMRMDINDLATAKRAKEVRLLIQKNRTQGILVWHKKAKEYFLRGGQFVDAKKNRETPVNERMEGELMGIEKNAENLEIDRLEKIKSDRIAELSKYSEIIPESLGMMEDEVYKSYLVGCKVAYEARIEAEKKAELDRLRIEQEEKEERERVAKENEKLKLEAIEAAKKAESERIERERVAKIEADKRAKELAIEKAKAEAEKKAREVAEAKREAEFQATLKAEKEAREKLENEANERAEAEKKAQEEVEAKRQIELSKGDEAKFNDLISDLQSIKSKYSFKSKTNIKKYSDVGVLIDKIINHISL